MPLMSPLADCPASSASGAMSGTASVSVPSGMKASLRARSPEILLSPSESDRPLTERLPSVVVSAAFSSSGCSSTLPVSDTSAEGLAMSALPLAASLMAFTVLPAAVRLSLPAVTVKSGAVRAPLAVSAKSRLPATGVPTREERTETSPSLPFRSAWRSVPVALAVPLADNVPDFSSIELAAKSPLGSRVAVAENCTRGPSTVWICCGSAVETASAFIASVMARSASVTLAVTDALSASERKVPSSSVISSCPIVPERLATTLPATSGASVATSLLSVPASSPTFTGPLRFCTLKPSEWIWTPRSWISVPPVTTETNEPATSTIGSLPSPKARAVRLSTATVTGAPPVGRLSTTGPLLAVTCAEISAADSGSKAPLASAWMASLSMAARSISTPPALVAVPAISKRDCPVSSGFSMSGRNRSNAPSPFTSMRLPASVSWWRPESCATTCPATEKDPAPFQSPSGPLPFTAMSTGGASGILSRLAMMPPAGSDALRSTSSLLSAGAKCTEPTTEPCCPSRRWMFRSVAIASGEASAFSVAFAASSAMPVPARSSPSAMSGRSICLTSTETGRPLPPPLLAPASVLPDDCGSRAISMRCTATRSARNVFESSASGDQSTATSRNASHGP